MTCPRLAPSAVLALVCGGGQLGTDGPADRHLAARRRREERLPGEHAAVGSGPGEASEATPPLPVGARCVQVVLYDVSGATLGVQVVGANRTSQVFPGLTPGRRYRGEVTTLSGELRSSAAATGRTGETLADVNRRSTFAQHKRLMSRTAPEAPTHLSIRQGPTNHSVELSWEGPASGDYDSFHLRWAPSDPLTVTRTHLTSRVLAGMFPGRVYNVTVVTVSGGGASGGPVVTSQPIQRSVRTSRSLMELQFQSRPLGGDKRP